MNIEEAPPSAPDDQQRPLERCKTNVETTDPSSSVVTDVLLDKLSNMPHDIMFEIFSMVHPLDLLMLARTSKSLRAFLMHPTSLPIWKGTLRRVKGLPDCTKFVSAPSFVHFIYEDESCAVCGTKFYDLTICRIFFARFCCHDCAKKCFKSYSTQSGYHKYLPCIELQGKVFYHKKTLNQWRNKYGRLGSNQAKKEWVAAQEKTYNEQQAIIKLFDTWRRDQSSRRKDEIVERLTYLGWGKEIALMDRPWKLSSLYRERNEMSERGWNENRPILIEFMEKTRANRLEAGHLARLKLRMPLMHEVREACVLANPVNTLVPPVAELYHCFPSFRAVVEEIPPEVEVTLEHFREAMDELPTLMPAWVAKMDLKLIDMMEKALGTGEKLDPSCLGRATTLFKCTGIGCGSGCDGIISYPRVLIHCGITRPHGSDTVGLAKDIISLNENIGQSLFNAQDNISFSPVFYKKAIEVVKLSGLPPTATADEIDKLDLIYECASCSSVNTRLFMTWRRAILHTHNVSLVSEDGIICEEAREKFHEYQTNNVWTTSSNLRCVHCRKTGRIADLKQYVNEEHGVPEATQDDIVPGMDANFIPEAVPLRVATDVLSAGSK